MEKDEEKYLARFTSLDYSPDYHHQQFMKPQIGENSSENMSGEVDYMLNYPPPHQIASAFCSSTSIDRLSFEEVMQFSDFGPKLALNQDVVLEEENEIDPVSFLKLPVLSDKLQEQNLMVFPPTVNDQEKFKAATVVEEEEGDEEEARVSENTSERLHFLGRNFQKSHNIEAKNKKKRRRTVKTSAEVENQRMTHIAVERNRRKQMNGHLRLLRSLMPSSYVKRGDQASIIGGAIEFVRELEQLLLSLESQKQRRLFGGSEAPLSIGDSSSSLAIQQPEPPFFPPLPPSNDQIKLVDFETGFDEETVKNKSCIADVEVKLIGFDAMIKVLSRRRPGQLLKLIAAFEDFQLNILHTNITTIEQTVLYSFNVKVSSDSRSTAEDIASSVQQIFNFIHASSTI